MKIAITGHRPNKLGNDYNLSSPLIKRIDSEIRNIVETERFRGNVDINDVTFITGMALGIDTLFALIAIDMKIPFIAAIPFRGQFNKWQASSINTYFDILTKASKIVLCTNGYEIYSHESSFIRQQLKGDEYSPHLMQNRNMWMVDNCDLLIAVWDGSSGGTHNCVRYAVETKREYIQINPQMLLTQKL